MIVRRPIHTFQPGPVGAWMRKYGAEGLPIKERRLNNFFGRRGFTAKVLALNAIQRQDVMIMNRAPFSPGVVTERP
jgi:hypothetical protein